MGDGLRMVPQQQDDLTAGHSQPTPGIDVAFDGIEVTWRKGINHDGR
jgi:hypothetical protein